MKNWLIIGAIVFLVITGTLVFKSLSRVVTRYQLQQDEIFKEWDKTFGRE